MREREIFDTARNIANPAERSAYLAEACGGDHALREHLEGLLATHPILGSFLEAPAALPAATLEAPTLTERAGTVIGPYKLLQQIGEGGMGTVFMAEQTEPVRRKVALKVIKPGMDTRQVIARFEAERQALAMMDHLNIARVLDVGATDTGRPYFVMELVHGVPITQYCDNNHLTPRERLELFVPVCQAIQHAHQKGIIHRDIKPSNVMVTLYDGKPVPKVIDFGVAKATEQRLTERTLFTQYGTIVGTLEYMSPEQAELSGLGMDTRGDIYSLGVLLYELLTGSTPLERPRLRAAAYAEVLRLIREEEPPKPSMRLSSSDMLLAIAAARKTEPAKLSRLLRGELDWIVLKALEKDRTRRYDTASGFAADVQRYLVDEPVEACPPSASYRLRKFARRNKSILATVSVVVLALMTGTVVSAWQAIRATDAESLAQTLLQAETEAQNATREQLHLTQQAEDKATQRLYRSLVAQTTASRLSQRIGQRFETLKTLTEATKMARDLNLPEKEFLKLRNEAIACLALPDLRIAKEWNGWPAGSFSVNFDSTLERYARVDRQGTVSVRRVADDAEICHLSGMGPGESGPLLSPDGQFLAIWHGPRFQLWKLAGKDPVKVLEGPMTTFAFSLDNRQFALALPDGSLCLYDLPSGRQAKQLGAGLKARALAFHPTGLQLAVSGATGVQVRDLATGDVVADLVQPGGGFPSAWHPDGRTIATVGADRIIHIWDVAARKPITRLEGYKSDGIYFAYDHAGDMLVSTSWAGQVHLWDPRTGRKLFSTQGWVGCLSFSADDRFLAAESADTKLRIWEVARPSAFRTFGGGRSPVRGLVPVCTGCAISPNGRVLAITLEAGVSFWDLALQKELAFAPVGNMRSVVFESDNALLTGGPAGLFRWPVQANVVAPGLLRIGPPTRLLPFWGEEFACSNNGRIITTPQGSGGLVLDRDHPDQPIPLSPHRDVRYAAVSPDGRWAATGTLGDTKVKIWVARTGKLEMELPVETGSTVGFSPDGKWLATSGGGLRLWAVASWQKGPMIGGGAFTYSRDGKLLAVDTTFGAVRLVAPDTGREYARLEDPHPSRARQLTFSPDGTQLAATNNDGESIRVWDLRLIREQLVTMGLDWDLPPYPPVEPDDGQPLRVEVDQGALGAPTEARELQRQGTAYNRSSQWEKAVGAYAKAIELGPKNAETVNNLAWLLATCPDAKFRDPAQAVKLAQKAVALAAKEGNYWNTLGAAHYRSGEWQAALGALEKSKEMLGDTELSFNAFFLAMAHSQLGSTDEARKYYDQAVRWMEKNKPQDGELRRFRAEVEELLKIENEAKPK